MNDRDVPRRWIDRWTAEDRQLPTSPGREDPARATELGEPVPLWTMVSIGVGLVFLSVPVTVIVMIAAIGLLWWLRRREHD